MRKLIVIPVLACTAILGLAACSNETPGKASPAPSVSTSTKSATPSDTTKTPAPSTPRESEADPATPAPSAIPNDPALDARFASLVKEKIPALAKASDEELVTKGKSFCTDFRKNADTATVKDFYEELKADYKLEPFDAGMMMGASTSVYCGEMAPKLQEASAQLGE